MVTMLIAAGANVDARDRFGQSPLHDAASYGVYDFQEGHAGDCIFALLDGGANPLARDAEGRTPWDLAQENDALRGSPAYWRLNQARFAPATDE